MRASWGVIAVVVSVLTTGCKKQGATPRLYTDAELETMAGGLDALLSANQSRACPRPVLRGTPAAGPAGADLLALTEPTDALATCATLLREQAQLSSEVLKAPLGAPLPPELASLPQACAELGTAIARAVQHEDACSPYLIGARPEGELLAPIALAKAAALQARELARAGRAVEAITLLLDTARFGQDVGREGGLVAVMVGTAMMGVVDRAALSVLRSDLPLTASELEAIDRALVVLIESDPHVRTMITAEVASQRLTLALPHLKPAGWEPPGGWPADMPRVTKKEMGPLNPRDYGGVMWEVAERWSAPLLAGCGETTTLDACGTAAAATDDLREVRALDLEDVERAFGRGELASAIREQVVGTLAMVTRPAFAEMVRNYPFRTVSLIRLRAQVAVRARVLAGAGCPTLADATTPLLADALEAATLGPPLGLEQTPAGLAVKAPAWIARRRDAMDLELRCPLTPPAP